MTDRRPVAVPGMTIGLLGGSFDPPHEGHLHISEVALRRIGLDRVWWLVSPGNPLKQRGPADIGRRISAARALIDGRPEIEVTDLETRLGTRYTADTLRALLRRYPGVRFVWLMGADNLVEFHRWNRWVEIFTTVPIAVLARPGHQVRAGLSIAAARFADYRLDARRATALPWRSAPCWTLLSHPMRTQSSTAIRAAGKW
jgi:nicotinate-nucleotide adenylyltransferase